MQTLIHKLAQDAWLRWTAAAVAGSLVLSAYKISLASTINNDGLLYLHVAQVFAEQGLGAAFSQFNWPFFSVLIGLLHKALGLGYEGAAYLLNALLLALLCGSFVRLYKTATAAEGRPWLAAAVVVLSPLLTDYRAFLVRDIGYWALSLWAVLHFCQYCRRPSWYGALAWQVGIAAAIAFRIEGAALAALLPLWCFHGAATPWRKRCSHWLGANGLFLLGMVVVLLALASGKIPWPSNSRFEQLASYLSLSRYGAEFADKADIVAHAIQVFYAPQDAVLLLLGGGFYLLLHKTVTGLGWFYAVPLGWTLWKKPAVFAGFPPIIYAAAITAVPLLAFAYKDFFLSGRYMGLLVLLLSLPAVRAIEVCFFAERPPAQRRYWMIALGLMGLVLLADIFIKTGPSKRYMREAGEWLQQQLPASSALCSEDAHLLYYAGRGYHKIYCPALEKLAQAETGQYQAFAIKIGRKEQSRLELLRKTLDAQTGRLTVQEFGNTAGDKLFIVVRGKLM